MSSTGTTAGSRAAGTPGADDTTVSRADDTTVPRSLSKPAASEFHRAETDAIAISPAVVQSVKEKIAQRGLRESPDGLAGDEKAQSSAERLAARLEGIQAADPPTPVAAPGTHANTRPAGIDRDSTALSSSSEIRSMLDKNKAPSSGALTSKSIDERLSGGDLDLSVPDTLGNLEQAPALDMPSASADHEPAAIRSRPDDAVMSLQAPKLPREAQGREALPAFPVDALRDYGLALWRFVRAQSTVGKAAMAGGAGLLMILLIIMLVALFSSSSVRIGFVDENQSLMAGPGNEEVFVKVASIERGEEVSIFEAGQFADYLLVRDLMGRAGYLPAESVSDYRPDARAGVPFVGCQKSPIEADMEACRDRAHVQFDSCRDLCEDGDEVQGCLEQCQRQLSTCMEGCAGSTSPAVPSPEPTIDEAGESRVATPPAKPKAKATKKRGKKTRKKKRRKR